MAFELTPVSAGPIRPEPGEFLQWQFNGVNLGDNRVAVVDIVGDPDVILASRGFGENSHVITIRKAPPAALSVGWASPIFGGTYAHANAGTGTWYLGPPVEIFTPRTGPIYAGLIGYTSGTVVWSAVWTPLVADPAPATSPVGPGGSILEISFANLPGFPPVITSRGLLTISATVDGVPTIDSVQIATGPFAYNEIAWGPTP
jgi:hypothetical protein